MNTDESCDDVWNWDTNDFTHLKLDEFEGHTEGLWTLCTWRHGRVEYDVVRDEGLDEDNNVIASIVGKWEERKSNMKLIAAAPELLAEVKQIHEILGEAFTSEAKHSGAEYLNMIARVTGLIPE